MIKQILIFLIIGIIFRLFLTIDGNFLFNMDSGRDMVDVREMIELKKLRLTGPTSAIEGLFNGPAWYYLLAIPYLLSGGDPYASILLEIALWAIGGFFLLKLISPLGLLPTFAVGSIWVASDYVVLTSLYAFNPNPVISLTPVFVYFLGKYLQTGKLFYSSAAWFFGGLFFNLEMNFGIFIPAAILLSLVLSSRTGFLKTKNFWIGSTLFIVCLLPQMLFDLRHNFLMTKSVINYLASTQTSYDFTFRLQSITAAFYNPFSVTLMNHKTFTLLILALLIFILSKMFKQKDKDPIVLICLALILTPFILYLFIPVAVNPWHVGGPVAAFIVLIGHLLNRLLHFNLWGKIIGILVGFLITFFAFSNIFKFVTYDFGKPNNDPALFKNEVAAIDFVYKYADGKNFKVYAYLPSIVDYPYQYLFWWYGKKKYGYVPGEYAYSPNKPQYISNKVRFEGRKDNFSGLVFLIKEPDRIKMRQAWENDFKDMQFIAIETVGAIQVEIRREVSGL